jgi:hypothetical protein
VMPVMLEQAHNKCLRRGRLPTAEPDLFKHTRQDFYSRTLRAASRY